MAYNVGNAAIHIKPDLVGFRRDLQKQWDAMAKGMEKDGDVPRLAPEFDSSRMEQGMREWARNSNSTLKVGVDVDRAGIARGQKLVQKSIAEANRNAPEFTYTTPKITLDSMQELWKTQGKINDAFREHLAIREGLATVEAKALDGVSKVEDRQAASAQRFADSIGIYEQMRIGQERVSERFKESSKNLDDLGAKLRQATADSNAAQSALVKFNLAAADRAIKYGNKGDTGALQALAREREELKKATSDTNKARTALQELVNQSRLRLSSDRDLLDSANAKVAKAASTVEFYKNKLEEAGHSLDELEYLQHEAANASNELTKALIEQNKIRSAHMSAAKIDLSELHDMQLEQLHTQRMVLNQQGQIVRTAAPTAPRFAPGTNTVNTTTNVRKEKVEVDSRGLEDLRIKLGTVGNMALRASIQGAALGTIGLAATGALPAVGALGTAIGNVGKLAAGIPALVGAGGVAMATFFLATNGVVDKVKSLSDTIGEDGLPVMSDYEEALDGASEGMRRLADAIYLGNEAGESMFQGLQDLRDATQDAFLEPVASAAEVMRERLVDNGGFDDLQSHFSRFGSDFGKIIENYSNFRFSDAGWADLNTQMENFHGLSQKVIGAIDKWQYAWNDMATVGSKYLPELGTGIDSLAGKFQGFIEKARNTGQMDQWFKQGISSAKSLGNIIGDTFGTIGGVFRASADDLNVLTTELESGAKSMHAWTDSMEGQEKIGKFFEETTSMASEFGQTFLELGSLIADHVTPVLSAFTEGLGPKLREAIGNSSEIWDAIAPSAEKLGSAVGNMMLGFQQFGQWVAPIARELLPMLANGLERVGPALGALLGPLGHMIVLATVQKYLSGLVDSLKLVAATAGGKFLTKISVIVAAFTALSVAIPPVASALSAVASVFTGFNDALGGIPAKLLAVGAAIVTIRRALTGSTIATMLGMKTVPGEAAKASVAMAGFGTAVRTTGTRLKEAGALNRLYWAEVKAAPGIMGKAKTGMSNLGAAASVVGSKMKVAGAGLMSAMGGGWGLAIMGGITAVASIKSAVDSYRENASQAVVVSNELKNASSDMFASMSSGSGALSAASDSVSSYLDKIGEYQDVGALGKLDANATRLLNLSVNGGESEKQQDRYTAAQDLEKAMKELGVTSEDVAKKFYASDEAWTKFTDSLKDKGAWDSSVSDFNRLRAAAQDAVESFETLGPTMTDAYGLLDEVASSGGQAAGSLNKLREASMLFNGTLAGETQGAAQLTNALDNVSTNMESLGGATLKSNGYIDATTSAGASLHDQMVQVGNAIGDAVESGLSVNDAFAQAQPILDGMSQATGILGEDWQGLLDKYQMTPERIETLMVLKTDEALAEYDALLQTVQGAMDQGKTNTTVKIENDATAEIADMVGLNLKSLGNDLFNIQIGADTGPLLAELQAAEDRLGQFDHMEVDAFAGIDTSSIPQSVADFLYEAGAIDEAKPTAIADMDITELDSKAKLAVALLFDLTKDNPKLRADLDNSGLLDAIGVSKADLDALDNTTAKPKIDADTDAARNKITIFKSEWDGTKFVVKKVQVDVNSPEAQGRINAVKTALDNVPADKRINLDTADIHNTSSLIEALGAKVGTPINGKVTVDSSSPQWALNLLEQLGVISIDREGNITVNEHGASEALTLLSNIKNSVGDREQTITTNYVERLTRIENTIKGAKGSASGGRLPKNSNGSRLPTTGPGTDKTDGILGVSSEGVPMSWVDAGEWIINARSSEKYNSLLAAINADALPGFAGGGTAPGKGRKKDNALIWQDVATGISTGATNGANNAVNKKFNGALGALGGAANGIGFAGVAAGIPEFSEVPKAWDETQAELESKWSTFTSSTSSIWANIETIIGNTFVGIDKAVKTDWTDTQNWTLTQFANLQKSTVTSMTSIGTTVTGMFNGVAADLRNTYNSGMVPVFNELLGAVNQSVVGFQNGAAGIATAWDTTREATAAPVRYSIGTVWNGGLVPMWNSASDLLGLQAMSPAPLTFATGGHVQGPGTETSDSIPAMLSDGEYVINAKATRKIGLDNLNALNSGNVAFAANAFQDKTFKDVAIHRASGGPVKGTPAWSQLKRGYDWARSRDGRPYVWGGSANGAGGADCSGFMSGIADVILGGDGTRQWATMNFPGGQQGAWGPGLGAGFSVGISDVHTAGTIGGVEGMPAVNVESGGINSRMKFGAADAAGADDGQFNRQFHMLIGGGGAFIPGMGRAGGVSMSALAADAIKPYQEKLAALGVPYGEGLIGNLPRGVRDKAQPAMEDKIMEAAASMQAMAGAAGVDLSGVDGSVVQQVQEVFKRHGWTGDQWDAASWIIGKESGWNPNISNPSSGAYGLFQFLGATKDKYLPGPDYSVPTQADAGARYIRDRYGNPIAAKGFWEQNNWYDNGGWLKPGVTRVTNETGKPEPVFNPGQWELLRNNLGANIDLVNSLNTNESRAASQARVDARHQETLNAAAAKEAANNDDDPDNDIADEEITPVITMHQWDQIIAQINKKVRAGDVDGVRGELGNIGNILSEAAEQIDWVEVMQDPIEEGVTGIIDGQTNDALNVFGIPDPDTIPIVQAGKDLQTAHDEQIKKEDEDLKKAQEDYTGSDENIKSKQESLDSAKKDLAKLQEELGGLTDPDDIADKKEAIEDKQKSIADLEKELAKAISDKEKAKNDANRLTADAYSGDSTVPLNDYVDPDAEKKKAKAERDARREAKAKAKELEKNIDKKATGGWISGPGGPTADVIPLLASAGEFMVRAASAGAAPNVLSAMNANPGLAASLESTFVGTMGQNKPETSTGPVFNYTINASTVDEGMRRAKMHERQTVAAYGVMR